MPLLIKRMECSIVYKHEMSLKRALLKVRRKHDPAWLFRVKLFVIVCKCLLLCKVTCKIYNSLHNLAKTNFEKKCNHAIQNGS